MFIGIEIGGTKLQFGVGRGDGDLVAFQRLPVDVAGGGEGIRTQILHNVPELLHAAKLQPTHVKGMAFGFGGPVDDLTRRVIKSHQVAGWDDFPLADWAEQQLGFPCILGNDSDVAGLAEATIGAGRGLSPVFYMNIGSGIGGALILDGEIYRGCGRGAIEPGHLWVEYDLFQNGPSPHPLPGGKGEKWRVLEDCASGWAIARDGRHAMNRNDVRAQDVADAARNGDAVALTILAHARRHIALVLSHVIALLCPRRIVLGGGVSLIGEELWFGPLREEVARIAFKPFADCYDIVPAALGEETVVHGALALAKRRFDN